MAPRRGGSSGGGGSGVSGIEDTPWGQTTDLAFGFSDPYDVARLVFQAIGLIGIVAIIVWAKTLKKTHEPNKKMFNWWAFWLTAIAVFVYMAINFTVSIISGAAEQVQIVFFLIMVIIFESSYLAEISLLLVLYILLPYCTPHPSRTGDKPRIAKILKIGHGIFLLLLTALWLPMFAMKIQGQVELVIGDPWTYRRLRRTTARIMTAYTVLYVFGSLEIAAWSILGLIKQRTQRGKTHLILLASIAAPLLLRSLYVMADTIYENLQLHYGGRRLWLATDIIYNLTTILIYAGIVAIARYFATTNNIPGSSANAVYDPHQSWNGPGLPPHDPAKPDMAVHESAPPPVYQQGNFQPVHGHGNVQYTMPSPPPPQQHQQQQQYLNQQSYPNHSQPIYNPQQQQQQQQPHQYQGYYTPQHQQIRSPQSPPPQQVSPIMQQPPQQQYHRPAPSEVSGVTSSVELPTPTHTPGPHAR
ncbi:MAG: hypothetical protein Q9169_004073 [Polycauliona sp. 2 TL-2023]